MVVGRAPPNCYSNPELCSCSRCYKERQGRYIDHDDDEGAPESTKRYGGNFQFGYSTTTREPEHRVKFNLDVVGYE